MVRLSHERVLLIGDPQREIHAALSQGVPGVQVVSVPTFFDGIAELVAGNYTTVLAAAEPLERRPEAAVRTLRELTANGRVILFGHPTLELLSRKMLQFGCDDYIVTPASAGELQQLFRSPPLRLSEPQVEGEPAKPPSTGEPLPALSDVPVAEILLDALLLNPHNAPAEAVRQINGRLGASLEFCYQPKGKGEASAPREGWSLLSHPVRSGNEEMGTLYLSVPQDEDERAARHTLAQLAHLVGKIAGLQDRHNRLQKLAITDELTGLYNARYFHHFLSRIIEKARVMRFPVTLALFDIDDFKKYNDHFGHGVGNEILCQTATLMRRCTREHDLVARIGGDEFAVVFWDKEGPRQPRDPKAGVPSRRPPEPLQIFERFKRLIASEDFSGLGSTGKGTLGISAALAVYPWSAQDAAGLFKAADEGLMFNAKQGSKNSIFLVGGQDAPPLDSRQ